MILNWLKAIAVTGLIAMAAVVILVIGWFIGAVLLFLGAVAGIALILYIIWKFIREHQIEIGK